MRETYNGLEMEVIRFESDDLIMTSGCLTQSPSCPQEGEPVHCSDHF